MAAPCSRIEHAVETHSVAAGNAERSDGARVRGEAFRRVLGVDADLDRMAADAHLILADAKRSPPAIRIISRTRSMPVTISVTGCSTWMRVFISRK